MMAARRLQPPLPPEIGKVRRRLWRHVMLSLGSCYTVWLHTSCRIVWRERFRLCAGSWRYAPTGDAGEETWKARQSLAVSRLLGDIGHHWNLKIFDAAHPSAPNMSVSVSFQCRRIASPRRVLDFSLASQAQTCFCQQVKMGWRPRRRQRSKASLSSPKPAPWALPPHCSVALMACGIVSGLGVDAK